MTNLTTKISIKNANIIDFEYKYMLKYGRNRVENIN